MVVNSFLEPIQGHIINTAGKLKGAHAIVICGWDDEKVFKDKIGFFRIRNSWGTNWADNGYAWVSYDYFGDNEKFSYLIEAWAVTDLIMPK